MIRAAMLVMQAALATAAVAQDWQVRKSSHFLVYHRGSGALAAEVAAAAERHYDRIVGDLGFTRYDSFWTWDARVSIHIHPSRDEFMRATGAPDWAAGRADYAARDIATYVGSDGFMGDLLPHEMTHLAFIDFIGSDRDVPLWLHEGVAQWEESAGAKDVHRQLARLASQRRVLPLGDLTAMDVRRVADQGVATLFYAEAVSVVDFLMAEYGRRRFGKFCRQLRDGKTLEEALSFTFSPRIHNIQELESEWLKYVAKFSHGDAGGTASGVSADRFYSH